MLQYVIRSQPYMPDAEVSLNVLERQGVLERQVETELLGVKG